MFFFTVLNGICSIPHTKKTIARQEDVITPTNRIERRELTPYVIDFTEKNHQRKSELHKMVISGIHTRYILKHIFFPLENQVIPQNG